MKKTNNMSESNGILNKKNEGITLIALVVTIIVLLILARNLNCNANAEEMGY